MDRLSSVHIYYGLYQLSEIEKKALGLFTELLESRTHSWDLAEISSP